MSRQQRTSTPRRSLNPATRPAYNPVGWLPIAIAGDQVTMQLSQDSSTLVRSGVPQVIAASIASVPMSVVWSGATMVLQYPLALSAIESFTMPPGDQSARTMSGGYFAATTISFGDPSPAPAGTIFSPYCSGVDLRGALADGAGHTADALVSAQSPSCGYTPPATIVPVIVVPGSGDTFAFGTIAMVRDHAVFLLDAPTADGAWVVVANTQMGVTVSVSYVAQVFYVDENAAAIFTVAGGVWTMAPEVTPILP